MKAKTVIATLLMLIILVPVMSQNRKVRMGNRYYSKYNYSQAVKYYSSVKESTLEIDRKLGHSYVMLRELEKAEDVYTRIMQNPGRNFQDIWMYYKVLQQLGEYEKAYGMLISVYDKNHSDSRVRNHISAGRYYNDLLQGKASFEIRNLKMNSTHQDFATVFYKDQVVFTSTRVKPAFSRRIWAGNQMPYLNLLVSDVDENREIGRGKSFDCRLNRKFHDGPVAFNGSGTLMAITRNNYQGKSSDGTRNLQLFISEYVEKGWTTPVAFPYNNPEYSVGQASLTPDGRNMYFVSDMPGGVGGTDIYRIERKSDGSWGMIENLRSINTEGNEMFPVYHPDGLLFFSSDGHPGLGGLDVFVSAKAGDNHGKPMNLGAPVNSSGDDFSLVLDKEQKFGYLSSNRIGGKGSDDIYAVNVLMPVRFKKIKGATKDNEGQIIANTEVRLMLDDKIIGYTNSDDKGNFEFAVDQEAVYSLTGTKEGYHDGHNTVNTKVQEDVVYADLILKKESDFTLKIIVLDGYLNAPITDASITLLNTNSKEQSHYKTNADGFYRLELSDNKLNDIISYNVKAEKSGYLTSSKTFIQLLYKEAEYILIIQLDPLSKELKVGDDLGKKFQINPIYFDFDKHDIRPDAAAELDKIVQIMNEYPTMVIELTSHTDCRGSFAYNTILSDKRAKSSAEYVKQRITNPERIYGKGMGESKPVNDCACEGYKVSDCSEEQHQMNRRTEFVIIRM